MAATITLTGDWLVSFGNRTQTFGTGNLGVYATSGIAVTPGKVGLGVIQSLVIDPAAGYIFEYIASTGKVKAYVTGANTHDVLIIGGQAAAGTAATAWYATDIFGKQAVTDKTILGADSATKGGVIASAQVALAEVTNAVDLSAITFRFRAIGY